MIFDPPVMALLLASAFSMLMLLPAVAFAMRVLRRWQTGSGSAEQIRMERQTHLVSTAVMLVMLLQLPALALFVHNADRMAVLFTGAMCAVGTLNVNDWGMPAFLTQVAVFFGAFAWLLLNAADRMGRDYPYIRVKYTLLLALAPVVVAGGVLQWLYFLNLDPNVITSCCSLLFTPEGTGVQKDLSAAPPGPTLAALAAVLVLLLALGLPGWSNRRVHAAFGLLGTAFFPLAIVAIISVVSPYIYETPNHHCPFCILKPQYGFIGYALYVPLFIGSALSVGITLLSLLPVRASVTETLPRALRRWMQGAAMLFAAFGLACAWAIWRSHLILLG